MSAPAKPKPEIPTIEPLLRMDDIAKLLACSRRTLEQMRSGGRFPRPDAMIGRSPRWRAETVRAWIAAGGSA